MAVDEAFFNINELIINKKIKSNSIKNILLLIDSQIVINWLAGLLYFNEDERIYKSIKNIYNKINKLQKLTNNNISIHIMKVHSHQGTLANEIADQLAKQSLFTTMEDLINNTKNSIKYESWKGIGIKPLKKEIRTSLK